MLLEPDLKEYLVVGIIEVLNINILRVKISFSSQTTYDKYKYLWADDREDIISEFVQTGPLTADIREKFIEYDGRTEVLEEMPKTYEMGAILINLGKCVSLRAWFIVLKYL